MFQIFREGEPDVIEQSKILNRRLPPKLTEIAESKENGLIMFAFQQVMSIVIDILTKLMNVFSLHGSVGTSLVIFNITSSWVMFIMQSSRKKIKVVQKELA